MKDAFEKLFRAVHQFKKLNVSKNRGHPFLFPDISRRSIIMGIIHE